MDPNVAQAAQTGVTLAPIIGLCVGLPIGLVMGAYLLKAACYLCRQPQPTVGSAMAIVFVNFLAQVGLNLLGQRVIVPMLGPNDPQTALIVVGGVFVVGVFLAAAIYAAMIPTSFLMGLAIWLMQAVVIFCLCGLPVIVLAILAAPPKQPTQPEQPPAIFEIADLDDTSMTTNQEFFADALREVKAFDAYGTSAPTAPSAPVVASRPRSTPNLKTRPKLIPNRSGRALETRGNEIDALLSDLDAKEAHKVQSAADRLAKLRVDESRQAEVIARLVPLLDDREDFVRWSVSNGLKTWANAEVLPALVKAMDDSMAPVRHNAMETLGRLQDPRAAEPLVAHLKSDKLQAISALKKLGPTAETAVLSALNDDDWTIRLDACQILQEIGTQASVPELKRHLQDENGIVRRAAETALRRIGAGAGATTSKKTRRP